MIDQLLRDVRLLGKSDTLIAEIWFTVALRRAALLLFAGLVAMFALALLDLAAFEFLAAQNGRTMAAILLAAIDGGIAWVLVLMAGQEKPGPELSAAYDIRTAALEQLDVDGRELHAEMAALRSDLRNVRSHVAGYIQNPLDLAGRKLLVPLVTSLVSALVSPAHPPNPDERQG